MSELEGEGEEEDDVSGEEGSRWWRTTETAGNIHGQWQSRAIMCFDGRGREITERSSEREGNVLGTMQKQLTLMISFCKPNIFVQHLIHNFCSYLHAF